MALGDGIEPDSERQPDDSGRADTGDELSERLAYIDVPSRTSLPEPPIVHYERPVIGARKTPGGEAVPTRVNVVSDTPSAESSSESNAASWGRGMAASLLLASSIFVSLYIGQWLDAKFHTTPWLTLVMTLLGIAAGFVNLFRLLGATDPKRKK